MFRNMATDLLRNGRINTTDTKAKEIRRVVEKLVTLGKNGSLHARRKALGYIRDRAVVEKLFSELAQRYMERPGGYTRIVKLGYRRGDNAPISLIELVTEEYKAKRKRRKAKPKAETGSGPKKSSKKKSAEELGLVEQEETAESRTDKQAEAEVTEAETEVTKPKLKRLKPKRKRPKPKLSPRNLKSRLILPKKLRIKFLCFPPIRSGRVFSVFPIIYNRPDEKSRVYT